MNSKYMYAPIKTLLLKQTIIQNSNQLNF